MAILVGMGKRMAERFLPIYLIALGGGAISVGILNGLNNLLSALYSFPGGYLSDRLGTKRALLLFNLIAMLGFLIVIFIPVWQAVLIGALFFLFLERHLSFCHHELNRQGTAPEQKDHGSKYAFFGSSRIPMALGPILGGLCIGLWGEKTVSAWPLYLPFSLQVSQ